MKKEKKHTSFCKGSICPQGPPRQSEDGMSPPTLISLPNMKHLCATLSEVNSLSSSNATRNTNILLKSLTQCNKYFCEASNFKATNQFWWFRAGVGIIQRDVLRKILSLSFWIWCYTTPCAFERCKTLSEVISFKQTCLTGLELLLKMITLKLSKWGVLRVFDVNFQDKIWAFRGPLSTWCFKGAWENGVSEWICQKISAAKLSYPIFLMTRCTWILFAVSVRSTTLWSHHPVWPKPLHLTKQMPQFSLGKTKIQASRTHYHASSINWQRHKGVRLSCAAVSS